MNLLKKLFNSSLVRSSGIYTLTTTINSAIPFLLLPILTRFLSPKDYGIIAMFQLLLMATRVLVGVRLHGAINREYFENDSENFPNYISNCFYIYIISIVFTGGCFWIFSKYIYTLTQFPLNWLWTIIAIASSEFIIMVVLTLWQVRHKAFVYGTFQILLTSLNLGLSVLFIVKLGMGWQGRIQGQLLANVIFAIIGFGILHKGNWLKHGININYIKRASSFSLPLIPYALSGWAINMTDRFLITNLVNIEATGVYTVGIQIGMVFRVFLDAFNTAWVPWLFERLSQNNFKQKIYLVKITYLYNIIVLCGVLFFSFLMQYLVLYIIGKDFIDASKFIPWITLGFAFSGMYKMVANYIFFAKKTYLLALTHFLTAILNLFISYFLILKNGSVGAAQGTMLAFFISFILAWIVSAKVYPMPWSLTIKS